jgi:hypothetical protein
MERMVIRFLEGNQGLERWKQMVVRILQGEQGLEWRQRMVLGLGRRLVVQLS